MITTPSMGLKRWDQPNDVFSYTELSDNFAAIDSHDHSSTKGVQVPTGGVANLAIDNTKIAANAVDGGKIAAASISASHLHATGMDDAITSRRLNLTNYATLNPTGVETVLTTSYATVLSQAITAPAAGTVALVTWQCGLYVTPGAQTDIHCFFQLLLDGVLQDMQTEGMVLGAAANVSIYDTNNCGARLFTGLASGAHTFILQAKKANAGASATVRGDAVNGLRRMEVVLLG